MRTPPETNWHPELLGNKNHRSKNIRQNQQKSLFERLLFDSLYNFRWIFPLFISHWVYSRQSLTALPKDSSILIPFSSYSFQLLANTSLFTFSRRNSRRSLYHTVVSVFSAFALLSYPTGGRVTLPWLRACLNLHQDLVCFTSHPLHISGAPFFRLSPSRLQESKDLCFVEKYLLTLLTLLTTVIFLSFFWSNCPNI